MINYLTLRADSLGTGNRATTAEPFDSKDGAAMIIVTRLDGQVIAINCDLIEAVEATPVTTITMVDGLAVQVSERVPEIIDRIRDFRASVVSAARNYDANERRSTHLRVLPENNK